MIKHISKVVKLAYLLRYTKNNALKLIEPLPVPENNYEVARNILTKTYLDIDEIKNDLALQLIKLPKCKDSYEDIFTFHCNLDCLLGKISNSNSNIEESSWLICALIFEKLPSTIKELFQTKLNKTYPKLTEIRNSFPTILTLYNTLHNISDVRSQQKIQYKSNIKI